MDESGSFGDVGQQMLKLMGCWFWRHAEKSRKRTICFAVVEIILKSHDPENASEFKLTECELLALLLMVWRSLPRYSFLADAF